MKIGDKWKDWTVDSLIGEGSFGQVFKIVRNEFGHTYESALKVIRIPQNKGELEMVRDEGMEENSIATYFRSMVDEIISEFTMMSELRGHSNIVSYEDHAVTALTDEFGWEIGIRMELLTPLNKYIKTNSFSIRDVILIGIDICRALEVCQKFNLIHRDIKPENIFVSNIGTYKLGDFGIARQMEKTTSGMSKKGTYSYMAPEVYKGLPYNSTVDIYSLGIVLYRLLNNNRTPFLPPYPQPIRYSDREKANVSRMSGEPVPAPCNAKGRLAEIILKACAYRPDDRYESATDMRMALESILYDNDEARIIYPAGDGLSRADFSINTHSRPEPTDATVSLFSASAGTSELSSRIPAYPSGTGSFPQGSGTGSFPSAPSVGAGIAAAGTGLASAAGSEIAAAGAGMAAPGNGTFPGTISEPSGNYNHPSEPEVLQEEFPETIPIPQPEDDIFDEYESTIADPSLMQYAASGTASDFPAFDTDFADEDTGDFSEETVPMSVLEEESASGSNESYAGSTADGTEGASAIAAGEIASDAAAGEAASGSKKDKKKDKKKAPKEAKDAASGGKKKSILPVVIAILAVIAAVGGFMAYRYMNHVVPDVREMTADHARETIESAGLVYTETREFNEDVEMGEIISQDPEADEHVKKGTNVNVVISRGKAISCPDLAGKSMKDAEAAAKKAGLVIEVGEEEFSDKVAKDSIISQDPAPETECEKGSVITVVKSKGKVQVKVPDVTGKSVSDATKALEKEGFKVSVEQSYNSSVASGNVAAQSVPGGQSTDKGATITITESLGPQPVQKKTTSKKKKKKKKSSSSSSSDDDWDDEDDWDWEDDEW